MEAPPSLTPLDLTYDAATNRITTTGYGYDNNGNLTAAPGPNVYGYDLVNRMTSVAVGGTVQGTYGYDGRGLRIRKVAGTTETFYFHTKIGLLGEYTRPAGTTQVPTISKEYVYMGSKAVATVTGPSAPSRVWAYHHSDRLGSVRQVTDSNKAVITTRDYYPFGEEMAQTTTNEQKFTGYYRDGESGLDYAQNRYHNSGIGRFLTGDPARANSVYDPKELNKYAYVGNDPINKIDPLGLWGVCPAWLPNCGGMPWQLQMQLEGGYLWIIDRWGTEETPSDQPPIIIPPVPTKNCPSDMNGVALAFAVYTEAGIRGPLEWRAVAETIINRWRIANEKGLPLSLVDIILTPGQYSAFNGTRAERRALESSDPINDILNFLAPRGGLSTYYAIYDVVNNVLSGLYSRLLPPDATFFYSERSMPGWVGTPTWWDPSKEVFVPGIRWQDFRFMTGKNFPARRSRASCRD